MLLCCFLNTCKGEVTGISFVDSTPIEVCPPSPFGQKLYGMACSKRSLLSLRQTTIWAYAQRFKLHLIISDRGELLAFKLTPGNVDDRKPVPEMAQDIFGKLFGNRAYISHNLFEKLEQQQLQLITRYKKKKT